MEGCNDWFVHGKEQPPQVPFPSHLPRDHPGRSGAELTQIGPGAEGSITLSSEDYTADIGTERTDCGRESLWARSQVINAARAAGVQPIDSVFSDVSDMGALRESVLEAKGLGFDGKGCIHPRQIAVVHGAFAPTKTELEQARKIVAAFKQAQKKRLAAVSLGSKMIDPPVVKRALRVVKLAEAMSE